VTWSVAMTADIVVVTERERQEPVLSLIKQLRDLTYTVHIIPLTTSQYLNRVPTPQLVLVDVMSREYHSSGNLPAALQTAWEDVPIFLFMRNDEVQRLRFTPVLHDFIALPIIPGELDARLRFALWKTQGSRAPQDHMQIEGLRMNMATYEVWVENKRIDLTYKEFELLKFFVSHRRRVFSRQELLEQVWESDYFGGTRTVDVHIRRLRAKLGVKVGDMIQTVRNVGYRFG